MKARERLGGSLVRIPYSSITSVHFSNISSTEILRIDIDLYASGSKPTRGVPAHLPPLLLWFGCCLLTDLSRGKQGVVA